jgi:hypothetical protein
MRLLRPFVDFWTKPVRAESLALFRILLGVTIIAALLSGIFRSMAHTCGPDGICPIEASDDYIKNGMRVSLLRGPVNLPLLDEWLPENWAREKVKVGPDRTEKRPTRLSLWLENWVPDKTKQAWAEWGTKLSSHYLLFALYLLSLVGLTLGFRPRLMALFACLFAATFHHRLAELMNGGDSLYRNGLYFLILAPSGATWSIDHWLRTRRLRARGDAAADAPVFIEPWSVRLMQIQVCIMYFFTGVYKLGEDYINGEALYWVLNDVAITRWPYAWLPIPLFICRLMTWTALAFELGFSFLVWFRPLRRWVLLMGIGLHLGILLIMEIGWFSQVTLCWYVLFVSGETISDWLHRTTAWLRGPKPVPEPAAA